MNDVLRAGPGMRVTLHFAVRLANGAEIDSNFDGEPASFVWGDESLLPGFEASLRGLKAGDRRSVYLTADKAFGERNPDNVQHFRRDAFAPDIRLAPGVVVNFADASGAEVPGVIVSLDEEDWVSVDFNHPLAGRDLTFEVSIVAVERDVPEQPVQLR